MELAIEVPRKFISSDEITLIVSKNNITCSVDDYTTWPYKME